VNAALARTVLPKPPIAESPKDDELVERFRSGERTAFDELVRRHQRSILLLGHRILRSTEDARDVAQRAFVQAYRQLGRFRGESSFRTWLYRIAANLALDALRKRGREARLALVPDEREGRDPFSEHRLRRAVEELPDRQRLVVELRAFEELSFREIGELVGSTEDAAKMNFHHALKRLRQALGETE
jgi:RNA polymerase sigma-70 factor (ECF subfamily)